MKCIVIASLAFASMGFISGHHPTPYTFPELKFFPPIVLPDNNPLTVEGANLGRYLFYDSILSRNYRFSCATCHQQAYAFSSGPIQFSSGSNGELLKRNTLPLFNLVWYKSFFWDGRTHDLESQVSEPLHAENELNMDWQLAIGRLSKSNFYKQKFFDAFGANAIDSDHIKMAIAQFERTLISANSKYDKVLKGESIFTSDEKEGFLIMNEINAGGCLHCHTTDGSPLGTNLKFSDNGLGAYYTIADYPDRGLGSVTGRQEDIGKFKIPSLRNIAVTAPYMHDGRFATLEEVLDFYSEGVQQSVNIDPKMTFAIAHGAQLSCDERQKIIAFLHTLTDSSFISNPEFANPFK